MKTARFGSRFRLLSLLLALSIVAPAQKLEKRPEQAPAPTGAPAKANSDPTYQQLRTVGLSGEVSAANNLVLKRDAGTFTFRSGSLYFLAPVNGKVTGAVFVGDGSFTLVPPLEMEKKTLALLTKEPGITEEFNELVLRFTDGTYDEIKKLAGGSAGSPAGNAAALLSDNQNTLRKKLHWNLTGRILQDVMGTEPGGCFVAFIKGKKYNGKMLFVVDPHGAPLVEPEEVSLSTYDENNWGIWSAFHYSHEYAEGKASGKERNVVIDAEGHKLDITLEKSAYLSGSSETTFVAVGNGVRVVPFDLYRTLRVESVTDTANQSLAFIQEEKDDDPDFFVILPKALAAGERYTIRTTYAGKDAVRNEGGGNYFPIARLNWYPNTRIGDYAQYGMTLHIPKGMKMAATGTLVREYNEGNQNISEWKSEVPQAVGGFNFGLFKRSEAKMPNYSVEAYANEVPPDWLSGLSGGTTYEVLQTRDQNTGQQGTVAIPSGAVGTLTTTSMMDNALAEGQSSVQLFTNYFGPAPYKHVALTQQSACNFGQSWPGLVYLPLCSFLDQTQQKGLFRNLSPGLITYFKVVTPHEVAHQWWAHTVGWQGYRDQWMGEGFAHFSASLYIQLVRKNDKEYLQFLSDLQKQLTDKNREGYRAIDVGPVTQGYRVSTTKSGFNVYNDLVYPKGAYILHMIRKMMWTPQSGDEKFKTMMQDFVKTYMNAPATTEDFKAMVEKHMTPEMDLAGNRKMDWFFDEYVYGTAFPNYRLDYSINGDMLDFKVTQSNVNDRFRMVVPLYLEFSNGTVARLGTLALTGNISEQHQVSLKSLKSPPKRVVLNYYHDVLSTQDK